MIRMTNAASAQAVEIGKEKLRDFLESSETGRHAIGMKASNGTGDISMHTLDSKGRRKDDDDDNDEI